MAPWVAPARIEAAVKFLRGRLIMVVFLKRVGFSCSVKLPIRQTAARAGLGRQRQTLCDVRTMSAFPLISLCPESDLIAAGQRIDARGRQRTIAKTHASYGLDCRVPPLVSTSLENALMPSLDLDRSLVRHPEAVPYKHRQQRDRDADKRGPDEEPDEAGMLDHEAREPSQNAARRGAERGQQAELARRMLH